MRNRTSPGPSCSVIPRSGATTARCVRPQWDHARPCRVRTARGPVRRIRRTVGLVGRSGGVHGASWNIIPAALWGYAGLTGGAPSVVRAATMFTLFTVAGMVRRQSDSMNSLASAAFVLLVLDPRMLGQLSFQFSFLAVLGILLFHDPCVGSGYLRTAYLGTSGPCWWSRWPPSS